MTAGGQVSSPDPHPCAQGAPADVVYLFTTFPSPTETFLQREITAMKARGLRLRLYSFWGGGGTYEGLPVTRFRLRSLWRLCYLLPWVATCRPRVLGTLIHGLLTRTAPSWLNFWENMLGAGFAAVHRRELLCPRPRWIHAAWGGAPATAAWLLSAFDGHRYSAAAHAYDIYEHGGDWWLMEKLGPAAFIHTSTEMGRRTLLGRGLPPEKVHCIRRGLPSFPQPKLLRSERSPLRLLCIARLVEKKGLLLQLSIYAALRQAGLPFEAHIVGEGPLRAQLEEGIASLGLQGLVSLTGHLSQPEVHRQFAWADVLLHTGIVAPSGDRDGLPNVIPEAMAHGVLVVSSPEAATTEAVLDEQTGLLADPRQPAHWVDVLTRLSVDDALARRLQSGAREWVLANYDAHRNAARLHTLFTQAMSRQPTEAADRKATTGTPPSLI